MDRPPLRLELAYRLLGWRLGPAYREWVHDDLTRPGWLVRQGAPVLASVLVLGGAITSAVGGSGDRLLALLVILTGVSLFLRTSLQQRALRQQGIDASGTPQAPWYGDEQARRQRNVAGALSTLVLVGVGLTLLALRSR